MKARNFKIRVGDQVEVIAGKAKGGRGEILAINKTSERVFVKDINKGKKHIKKTATQAGTTIETERSMHVSNIMLVDPKTDKPTRVGYKKLADNKKVRVAKKSGQELK